MFFLFREGPNDLRHRGFQREERESMLLVQKNGLHEPAQAVASESLSFSGSNQAREGRLVDALAVRGDEGRDTLRYAVRSRE